MGRSFVGSVVAGLLVAVWLAPPAPAFAAAAARGQILHVHREYGKDPVIVPPGVARVRLTFHGLEGHKVGLNESATYLDPCGRVALRGPSGRVAPWLGGAWKLPARGRYSFVVTRCTTHDEAFVQLMKIRLRQLAVDGDAVVLRSRGYGAYTDWATVVTPRRGRVQVRPTSTEPAAPWAALHLEGAPMLDIGNWHAEHERVPQAVYLDAGAPVANEVGTMETTDGPLVPRAGQRVILIPGERRVRARALRALAVPGAPDGAAVPVAAERRYQEVGLRFRSEGDQWVTATVKGQLASRSLSSLALTGPDGSTLVGLNHATAVGSPDLWYLPEAGSYRLMARTDPAHESGRIRLSTVRELEAEMPADGQPLAFTAQEPGEWVLATGQLGGAPYQLTAEPTVASEWLVAANKLPFNVCRSSFCDFGTSATLSPESPSHYPALQAEGRWVFLVAFGAGQSGTVNLRLTAAS